MPHIVIDGQHIEAQQGNTVLQVAYQNGIDIPHFCWHPELSISGNCRMCLVEVGFPKRLADGTFEKDKNGELVINYFPKLQIACATQVSEGMNIRTKTDTVIKSQEIVMEFFLINHPLDCPICDEAGQCKLQEYAFNHSTGESRFIEEKVHNKKRISWGPNVLYDGERCIKCSRCIRFAQEIAGQDVLTFVNRGDHVTIELFEGKEFDSKYSMNVIDICPVGALTSKDFRFKARVWDMSFNNSICPGCARGCNISLGVRNNEILRIEPKPNKYVNSFWMCDYGRLTQYPYVNNQRITEPLAKQKTEHIKITWADAVNKSSEILKKYKPEEIMFIGSGKSTNEDIYIFSKFVKQVIKSKNIDFIEHTDDKFEDKLLRKKDLTPNSTGAKYFGLKQNEGITLEKLGDKINNKEIKALFLLDDVIDEINNLVNSISKLEAFILVTSNYSPLAEKADLVLPSSTYAEIEGTYINFENRVQHFEPALVTSENLRYMGMKMSRLDKFGAHNDRWTQHVNRNCKQVWKIIQGIANKLGSNWNYKRSEDVFTEIEANFEDFKGMSYELLDEYQGIKLSNSSNPDEKVNYYESHYMKPM